MDWYYDTGGRQTGPITELEIHSLVSEGKITAETKVWHQGMQGWQQYAEAVRADNGEQPRPVEEADSTENATCCECGKTFSTNDMIRYEDAWVCATCKPLFIQRLKEGAAIPRAMVYGTFWIRFAAKFIDGLIIGGINMLVQVLFGAVFASSENVAAMLIAPIFQFSADISYATYFLGRFGATPGKMACGLKVVTPDGEKISYARACGRYFAEMLSGLILCIGYIMAAFDEEKRTLHDRICDTRVIKK